MGKSTLLRQALRREPTTFITLDDPLAREFSESDPRGFLEQAPGRTLAIDEVQHVPALALALKAAIDADRRPGRFAVTGSADLLRVPGVSDSLAGRVDIVTVHPLSQGEIRGRSIPEDWVTWILQECAGGIEPASTDSAVDVVIAGGYPEPLKRPSRRASDVWFRSYVASLVQHDARQLGGSGDFALHVEQLLRLIASHCCG